MPALAPRLAPRPRRTAEPSKDPRYQQVLQKIDKNAGNLRRHPPASKKAAEASAAAKGPLNERAAGAKAKQVDKIQEAPTEKPKNDSFLAVLQAEIAKAMPKTLGDTEKFMKGGSSGELKGSLKGNVSQQTDQAAGGVESASKAAPSQAGVQTTEGKPIPGDPPPAVPPVNAAEGMPSPKPDAEVSLQASKDDANNQMQEAEVTSPQLQKANDPRFSSVLTAKSAVDKQADAGPAKYRAGEQAVIAQTASKAQAETKKGAASMIGVQGGSKSAVLSKQMAAKAKDEAARKAITDEMEAIYAETKTKVETNLNSLEQEVGTLFDTGVDAALKAMTDFVDNRLLHYKIDRYLSIPIVGAARWIRDQFLGLPDEVNAFYQEGRSVFTARMNALVVRVAALVEMRLKQAKAEVANGQNRIKNLVARQPKELQSFAQNAAKEVSGRFEELEHSIDDKKNQLAQQLAQKYKEGFDKAEDALKKIQDENKGLVAGFIEKLGEVIKILTEFKNKLMSLLRKGADAIKLVLADPIGFLGNLLAAIKQGFTQFVSNIWTHLKKGFMTWLFGELADTGIEIPSDLSLASILKLVLGVLGLTWARAKAEAVKMIGPTAVGIIAKLVEYLQTLWQGGPAALWEKIKEDISNLKAMVIDAIQDWLITTIVKRAVAKIVTMFNPAGAIIQAIMMIYQVVTFVIERANQIMAFVEAVINSVTAIAQGAISGAATWIENALGRLVPVLIGLLASLIGLGGIGAKIKETITKIQDTVWGAIRKFLKKAIDFVKKMWGKLTGKKDEKDPAKEQNLQAGLQALDVINGQHKDGATLQELKGPVAQVKQQHPVFTSLSVQEDKDGLVYDYTASPGKTKPGPVDGNKAYRVDQHKAEKPDGVKIKGESHHVPAKVLQNWIGEILMVAGNELGDPAQKARGAAMHADKVGTGLSAIWLSEKNHDAAHESSAAKPSDFDREKNEIIVATKAGTVTTRPMTATIARSVHASEIPEGESSAETKKQRNKAIFKKFASRLGSLFRRVHAGLLQTGLAGVENANLKDNKWKAKLKSLAKSTWKDKLDPKG